MKSIKYMSMFVLGCGILLSSCGLSKMVKKQSTITYSVNPNPVEVYAGKMPVEIKGTFPPKYFKKKATMTFTPTIQTENGATVNLNPVSLKGEKAEGDGKVITYKKGGSFIVSQDVIYKPEYENCEISGDANIYLKSQQANLDPVFLGVGSIVTADRIRCNPNIAEAGAAKDGKSDFIISNHNYSGPKAIEKEAVIYYELNKDNLNWNLKNNKDSKNKEALNSVIPTIAKYNVKSVEVTGWASPEGELKRNSELSSNRSKVAVKWVKNEYDKYVRKQARAEKKKIKDVRKDFELNGGDKGEDWDGFIQSVKKSSIRDKDKIVNVIKSQSDGDLRQQQIRNMIAMYDEIDNDILPGLRRANIKVICQEEQMSDAQILDYAVTKPDTLDNNEMLYAASMEKNLQKKFDIYEKTINMFPEDFRAYNNLACVCVVLGQRDKAQKMFDKANELAPKEGTVLNNLGVLAIMEGDYEVASKYFDRASEAGLNSDYNQGLVSMKKGDYTTAANKMKGVKCDYNLALSYIASKDFEAAKSALKCINEKTAEDYYLLAVVGARTNDANLLYGNLKEACKKDSSLKVRAAKDMEFYKYRDKDEFKSAIQ